MRTLKLVVASGLMCAMAAAFAGTDPGTGITSTKHDWAGNTSLLQWKYTSSSGVTTVTTYNTGVPDLDALGNQTKVTVSIGQCTKCHTPHQAKSTTLLWNHTLSSDTYKWDVTATTAGTNFAEIKGDTYKGSTTKCLSCHDGVMASTDGMWFNRQMTSGSKYKSSDTNALNSGHEVAIGGKMSGSHPVAMPYPINGEANYYNGSTNGQQIAKEEWVADPMATNGIRLFNDNGSGQITAGVVAGKTGIECSSCHDVHNGKRAVGAMLLTGKLDGKERTKGGYICTQCHLK